MVLTKLTAAGHNRPTGPDADRPCQVVPPLIGPFPRRRLPSSSRRKAAPTLTFLGVLGARRLVVTLLRPACAKGFPVVVAVRPGLLVRLAVRPRPS